MLKMKMGLGVFGKSQRTNQPTNKENRKQTLLAADN